MTHTATPWVIHGRSGISQPIVIGLAETGPRWTLVKVMQPQAPTKEANANAARIVACVNACDGVSNAALDAGVIASLVKLAERVSSGDRFLTMLRVQAREALALINGQTA